MPADIVLVSEEEAPVENYVTRFMDYCLVTQRLADASGEEGWPRLHPPHLGIAALASYLRRHGFKAERVDNFFRVPGNRERLRRLVEEGAPVLGVSTSLLFSPETVRGVIDYARQANPGIAVVLGGASARRPEIRELGDFAVTGPGERPLLELLAALKAGRPAAGIKGVWSRAGAGMTYGGDPDPLPMAETAFPDWGDSSFRSSLCYPMELSRGCAHRCAFCSYPGNGAYSALPPQAAAEELARNRREHGISVYRFMDSDFAARPRQAEELCDRVAGLGLDLRWTCYARVDALARRPGLARKMREAGCAAVFLGIESGDDGILRSMGKNYCSADILEGVAAAREAGILTHGNFIVGFPGETAKTVDRTLDVIRRSRLDMAAFFLFWVQRHSDSPVWKDAARWGIEGDGVRWRHSTMDAAGAEEQVSRALREVLTGMRDTVIGNEYWVALMMGYGLSPAECMAYMRDVRDYQLALLRGDEALSGAAAERLLAVMRRMNGAARELVRGRAA